MRSGINLVFALLLVTFVAGCSRRPADPDTLAEEVFKALVENDKKGFEQLVLVEKDELIEAVRSMGKRNGIDYEEVEAYASEVREKHSGNRKEILDSFDEVRQHAAAGNFSWASASFVRAEYEMEEHNEGGWEAKDIQRLYIVMSFDDAEYRMQLRYVTYVEDLGFWFCHAGRGLEWDGEYRERSGGL